MATVMTVRGPISPSEFGRVLAHEHVMVDFVGADKTGPHRWDADEVRSLLLPLLREVKERGFDSFV
ncbi:phosphotriesterase, partial [Candidatus Poribacteria bacterium]|nr:phosphotriesterase [Candidatus Poribacteria bacterium]